LYQQVAEVDKNPRLAEIYSKIAKVELDHAEHWAEKYTQEGGVLPQFKPRTRTRILSWLARRFGASVILPSLQTMEQEGTSSYSQQGATPEMISDEAAHAGLIGSISRSAMRGGMEGEALAQLEGRHRTSGGNALRAAVLGANDGLVSNLSLVMGVAGASAALDGKAILIAGFAGLLAGASSMALGEWLSVQSSRELFENQVKIEKMEIARNPEEEAEELALIYEARGLTNKENAVETLAREELGINPSELGGSAWEAAITSFILFALGAIIPVIPFLLLSGGTAVLVSIGLSTLGLFGIGASITLFTGRNPLYSGARMVIFGLIAAAITFGIGKLIGVSIGA
jgi:VIT1/CCC1 family predicted Fe2+/Mn2+ transporter